MSKRNRSSFSPRQGMNVLTKLGGDDVVMPPADASEEELVTSAILLGAVFTRQDTYGRDGDGYEHWNIKLPDYFFSSTFKTKREAAFCALMTLLNPPT